MPRLKMRPPAHRGIRLRPGGNAENKKRRRRHTPNFLLDVSSRASGGECMRSNLILFVLVNQNFIWDEEDEVCTL
jgi:hypothetical protein